jgi:hypothetical protein
MHPIEHKLVVEIKNILHTKQTCLNVEKYLVSVKVAIIRKQCG